MVLRNNKYKPGIVLFPGEYLIKISKKEYQVYTEKIIIKKAQHLKKKISIKQLGKLLVKTIPKDAQVRILNIKPKYKDGILLELGKYRIRASKPGYKTRIETHIISPGENIVKLHPHSGWPQEAPQRGAVTLGKPQRG